MTENSFRDFYAAHMADVWRFARRRTDSDADADDITAETFAVAWRRRDAVPPDADRLWLFGVARKVLTNHNRQRERRQRLHLRLVTTDLPPEAQETVPPSEQVLWSALAQLSRDDRELLLMLAWDGLDVSEIAVVLRSTAATVSSRLYRARARLRRQLDRRDPGADGQVQDEPHGERSGHR
jgi:RNA polymerase sigma-70 factor, ECF subfamily